MTEADRKVKAALLIIGNEILSGRTQDLNLAHIGKSLNEAGIQLLEARVVADIETDIIDALNRLRARYSYVFTTGGIGPTHDDITSLCVAKAFGVALERNQEAERRLLAFYTPDKANAARMRMADIPVGANLIDNPVSVAPGFNIGNVYVMAGIPKIMQAMLDNIIPTLSGGKKILSRTVVMYEAESVMAPTLKKLEDDYPGIEVGSYPFQRMQRFGTAVVIRSTEQDHVDRAALDLIGHAKAHNIEHVDQG